MYGLFHLKSIALANPHVYRIKKLLFLLNVLELNITPLILIDLLLLQLRIMRIHGPEPPNLRQIQPLRSTITRNPLPHPAHLLGPPIPDRTNHPIFSHPRTSTVQLYIVVDILQVDQLADRPVLLLDYG